MTFMDGTICEVSDVGAAMHQLGGKFDREDCGFFSKCTHIVEKYDATVPNGSYVQVVYCETDWMKAAPLMFVVAIILFYVWRRAKNMDFSRKSDDFHRSSSSRSFSKYDKYGRRR